MAAGLVEDNTNSRARLEPGASKRAPRDMGGEEQLTACHTNRVEGRAGSHLLDAPMPMTSWRRIGVDGNQLETFRSESHHDWLPRRNVGA